MVKSEIDDSNTFLKSLKNGASKNDNDNNFWSEFDNYINSFITFILDFRTYKISAAIISLIIFILSLTTGGYYYIFKSLKNLISVRLPSSVNPSIIFFIIKIIVFNSLFKLILKTLFGLIFISIEDEEHCCQMKELIDKITNIITAIFFTFYMIFLIPTYLLNNVSNMYGFVINGLEDVIKALSSNNINGALNSLNDSKTDIKRLQNLLDKEVFEYYKLLEGYDGHFTSIIKSLMKDIFIEESPDLEKIKKEIRKMTGNSIDFDKEEDNINVTSCSYAMSINIYAIFLGIVYLLLSMAFPDSSAIVIILFIIIVLIVVYCMYQTFSFKLAIGNFKFLKAYSEHISADICKNVIKCINIKKNNKKIETDNINQIKNDFSEHIKKGVYPISRLPIIQQIFGLFLTPVNASSNIKTVFKEAVASAPPLENVGLEKIIASAPPENVGLKKAIASAQTKRPPAYNPAL